MTERSSVRLDGRVVLVTGASRGVGRGIAFGLLHAGATVYASGRSIDGADLDDGIVRVACDHTEDQATARLFERIEAEQGRLDVLVNNAWGGYERMVEGERFTWGEPFWEQPAWRWRAMMDAGVRAAFAASRLAARMMVAQRSGLIVNVSHWAAQKRIGNAIYGVAKAATDKLTADAAEELRKHCVFVVSPVPRTRPDGSGPRRRLLRPLQLGEPGISGAGGSGARCRPGDWAMDGPGTRDCGAGRTLRLHGHRRQVAAAPHLGRRLIGPLARLGL